MPVCATPPPRRPLPEASLMRVVGLAGWSGSGKTTLVTALIPIFNARGLSVSTIKHTHHQINLDQPGKDSDRHAKSGASEVMLAGPDGFTLFAKKNAFGLPGLLARLAPVDFVLIEGFRGSDLPKLEVYRPVLGKPPLWPEMDVIAVACDAALPDCPRPVFALEAPELIVDFLMTAIPLNKAAGLQG